MDNIRQLIDAIEQGKSVDIQKHFEAVVADKMLDAIEQKKQQVTSTLFNKQSQD
jgi:hypothetical protein